ncbi:hypothetical protein I4F81_012119 [Pyropia yezoensis]|uniref:Uncharacterized protein n=1 Tax=Pyropia yezoensis TaxID=2788 RepID=A0ACC3CIA4_PYRYE|nr:hypothetical protein I4F81_012119 [Neopyropia yezoensis]
MVNERTNVNVSVGRFGRSGGDVYARTDGNVLLRVDPESLAVTGRTSYEAHNKELRGPLSSAHPSTCPETGDTYNFTMDFGAAGATYKVFCVPAEGGLSGAYEVARFDAPPSYIHSFFLTSRYVVLGGWPALFRPLRMLWGGNVANAIDFDAASPATFYHLELPRINPAYATRRHTHTYGASYVEADTERGDFYWNALAKISTVTPAEGTGAAPPTVVEWSEAGCYPSEPVFVARPGGTAEDDGVVLSVVVDVPRQRTFLLVLDAPRFSELARAEVDAVVPLTFHGAFLDEEAAASD